MSPAELMRRVRDQVTRSRHQLRGRPHHRSARSADAGITLLRTSGDNEIWCRCDGGLSMAAHAHADPLSVEVRYAGVDILAYPGILCYHGERGWQVRSAHTHEIEVLDDGDIASWTAKYGGYASADPSVPYRRSVLLDRASRSIDIIDQIVGDSYDIRLAFQLGSDVRAELNETCAVLCWPTASTPGRARLELPLGLRWSLSPDIPATRLLGCGRCAAEVPLVARLEFLDVGRTGKSAVSRLALSWTTSAAPSGEAPEIQAEAR
jgi:hypothetical protein